MNGMKHVFFTKQVAFIQFRAVLVKKKEANGNLRLLLLGKKTL
jgi:hypothetical protein